MPDMEWIAAIGIICALGWLARLEWEIIHRPGDRCDRCGGPLELTRDALDLVNVGFLTSLPAWCPACGASGKIMIGVGPGDVWNG